MLIPIMTVFRTVPELGVVLQQKMNAEFVMVIILPVLTVLEFPMVQPQKIIAVYVTLTRTMTAYKTVPEPGVVTW